MGGGTTGSCGAAAGGWDTGGPGARGGSGLGAQGLGAGCAGAGVAGGVTTEGGSRIGGWGAGRAGSWGSIGCWAPAGVVRMLSASCRSCMVVCQVVVCEEHSTAWRSAAQHSTTLQVFVFESRKHPGHAAMQSECLQLGKSRYRFRHITQAACGCCCLPVRVPLRLPVRRRPWTDSCCVLQTCRALTASWLLLPAGLPAATV